MTRSYDDAEVVVETVLEDCGQGFDGKLPVRLQIQPLGISVCPQGYGDATSQDGCGSPVFLEFYEGELHLCVWDDINEEDVKIINLEGARESKRQPKEDEDDSSERLFVEVSPGELLDKDSILHIKLKKIQDELKQQNVRKEKQALQEAIKKIPRSKSLFELIRRLYAVNLQLWETEDLLRAMEKDGDFDALFVEAARAVYKNNDLRAEIKREINDLLSSRLREEKSY